MSTSIEPLNPADPAPYGASPPSPGLAFLVFWLVLGLAALMFFPRISPGRVWQAYRAPFIIVTFLITNIALWIATVVALGGDAVNGAAEDGRYFVRNHQFVWEVSRTAYLFNRYHTFFTIFSIPASLIALRLFNKPANDNTRNA